MNFLLEPFQFNFFQTAFIASLFIGIITPILGSFIVVARQSVISDMLSHTALAGVGLGVLIGTSPSITSFFVILLSGFLLWLFQKSNHSPESISMVLLTGGLSLAILFISLAPQSPINLEDYLFGSILTITQSELTLIIFVTLAILTSIIFQWNNLIRLIFSPDYYESTSRSKKWIELLFILLTSLLVAISLKTIGGLLIGGLIVIPVLAAQNLTSNFKTTTLLASILGLVSCSTGLISSYHLDIPTSSTIILTSIIIFLFSIPISKIYEK